MQVGPHIPVSEKGAKLAQKLGQLQPFIAVSHMNAWVNLHLLGHPNAVLTVGTTWRLSHLELLDKERGAWGPVALSLQK
jgi:hypothetical protein